MELVGKTLEDEEHLVLMGVSPFNEVRRHGQSLGAWLRAARHSQGEAGARIEHARPGHCLGCSRWPPPELTLTLTPTPIPQPLPAQVHGSAQLDESKYLNIHDYHAPQKVTRTSTRTLAQT